MDTPPREQTPQTPVCRCTRSGCTPAKRTLLEISPAKCTPKMEGGSVLFRNTTTHLPTQVHTHSPTTYHPPTHLPIHLTTGSLNTEDLGTTEHSRNSNVGKFSHSLAPFYLTFRHRASCILGQAFHYSPVNAFYIFNQKYISLSDICLTVHH